MTSLKQYQFIVGLFVGAVLGVSGIIPDAIRSWDIAEAHRRLALSHVLGDCGPSKEYPRMFSETYEQQMAMLIDAYQTGTIYSEWWEIPHGHGRFREVMAKDGEELIARCKEFEKKN